MTNLAWLNSYRKLEKSPLEVINKKLLKNLRARKDSVQKGRRVLRKFKEAAENKKNNLKRLKEPTKYSNHRTINQRFSFEKFKI